MGGGPQQRDRADDRGHARADVPRLQEVGERRHDVDDKGEEGHDAAELADDAEQRDRAVDARVGEPGDLLELDPTAAFDADAALAQLAHRLDHGVGRVHRREGEDEQHQRAERPPALAHRGRQRKHAHTDHRLEERDRRLEDRVAASTWLADASVQQRLETV